MPKVTTTTKTSDNEDASIGAQCPEPGCRCGARMLWRDDPDAPAPEPFEAEPVVYTIDDRAVSAADYHNWLLTSLVNSLELIGMQIAEGFATDADDEDDDDGEPSA